MSPIGNHSLNVNRSWSHPEQCLKLGRLSIGYPIFFLSFRYTLCLSKPFYGVRICSGHPTIVTIDSISFFVISALHNFIDSPFDFLLIFLFIPSSFLVRFVRSHAWGAAQESISGSCTTNLEDLVNVYIYESRFNFVLSNCELHMIWISKLGTWMSRRPCRLSST